MIVAQIIAEINTKRISMHHLVGKLPMNATIRFRHFSGKGGAPMVSGLKTELVARGVPPDQANHRASAILASPDPWACLKKADSSCTPMS